MTTEEAAKEYFEHRFRALDGETQREEKLMCGIAYRVLRQKTENNDPLTLDELREMPGEPVWCAEMECWGIVEVETVGCWANKPFLVGAWHAPTCGSAEKFECDIEMRGLTLYRRKPKED